MVHLSVTYVSDLDIKKISLAPCQNTKDFAGCGVKDFIEKQALFKPEENLSCLPSAEDGFCQDSDINERPTTLVEDEEMSMFGFRRTSSKSSMMEVADSVVRARLEAASPRTLKSPKKMLKLPQSPLVSSARTPRTPKTPHSPLASLVRTPRTPNTTQGHLTPTRRNSRATKSLYRTPTAEGSGRRRRNSCRRLEDSADTPQAIRAKVKKRITTIACEEESDYDDSDLDKDFKPSDSEESESDFDENETPFIARPLLNPHSASLPPSTPLRTPRRGRKPKVDVDMAASTEDYFTHHSEPGSCLTSDHTLSKLEVPRLGPEALKSLLEGVSLGHKEERRELFEDHATLIPHWLTVLCEGFSVFLCGVGSKKCLLNLFQLSVEDADHVVVNGFFPSLSIKTILSTIVEEIMESETQPQCVPDQLFLISSHYNNPQSDDLFVIVHNLDGPMLRNDKAQVALSQLASCSKVHLIASLDHVNSPLLFDLRRCSAYNALWWDATTLAPYTEETSYENSLMVQQTGALALSSLLHVFKSLTPNAKGIFVILARNQLSAKDNPIFTGLSFSDLYRKCRESFLVNSDLTLRAQLTEFKDHKLLKTRKGHDGTENLFIPLEAPTLAEFIEQQEDM